MIMMPVSEGCQPCLHGRGYKLVQGNSLPGGFHHSAAMKLRTDTNVENAAIGLLRLFPQVFTVSQIIVNGFVKLFFHLVCLIAFEIDQILNAFDFAVQYPVFHTVFDPGKIAFVFQNVFHLISPFLCRASRKSLTA